MTTADKDDDEEDDDAMHDAARDVAASAMERDLAPGGGAVVPGDKD